ncbi:50S ribosomal protein L3 [Candidatus Bathyarchaeota archaeon]|nr:50S ribosomal protein L3 [Candidatus Bathyarchaeota archaeon]MBS7627494.1 50S ribosomal protein L3 [Candidatus Bathyarchaeota archaeon]
MGHRKRHAPKRGSLAFIPKGRSRSLKGRLRSWPDVEGKPSLLGFAAYKAGMSHSFIIDDDKNSPYFGKEIVVPITVLDAPPMIACGLRAYMETTEGLKSFREVWSKNLPKDLRRVLNLPENTDPEEGLKAIETNLERISEFRAILCTQPRLTSLPKKKPDILEIKIGGGTIKEQFAYGKEILGKPVSAKEVLKEGQYVDVSSVSKGKGFQGVVKRWGVKRLSHKSRKRVREVGTLGPWSPSRVMYTVPRPGQLGLFQRTEYNKRILRIGEKGDDVTPKGGFTNYGVIKGDYILLSGSIPGPNKRLIRLRYAIRPPSAKVGTPTITYVRV